MFFWAQGWIAFTKSQRVIIAALLIGTVAILLINAWVAEDAFISFRVLDNAVNGYGLRWNIAERVQAYTHPLWVLLMLPIYAVTHEAYLSSIVVSLLLAAAALAIGVYGVARSYGAAVFALVAAGLSTPFVDYATSGLENALAYLLVSLFFLLPIQQRVSVLWISGVAALLVLTRHDLLLLVTPALLWVLWQRRSWGVFVRMVIGFLPVVAWEIFSLWYYGFLFPNTAYAKLSVGLPREELLAQGGRYLLDTAASHPIIIAVIAFAGILAALQRSRIAGAVVFGIMTYVAYVVWVGGDFMSGRFMAVPFWAAVLVCAYTWPPRQYMQVLLFSTIVILGFLSIRPIWTLTEDRSGTAGAYRFNGIVDEKSFYFDWTGLVRGGYARLQQSQWMQEGLRDAGGGRVEVRKMIGIYGYAAGPTVHIIDEMALADPLLARLPALPQWRIGHFKRDIPDGYVQSIENDRNEILDVDIFQQYEDIRRITRGSLWDMQRLRLVGKYLF